MKVAVTVALLSLALACSACGAAQARDSACTDKCGMAFMSCIEKGGCVDTLTGQIVPCEQECGAQRAACEADCGG